MRKTRMETVLTEFIAEAIESVSDRVTGIEARLEALEAQQPRPGAFARSQCVTCGGSVDVETPLLPTCKCVRPEDGPRVLTQPVGGSAKACKDCLNNATRDFPAHSAECYGREDGKMCQTCYQALKEAGIGCPKCDPDNWPPYRGG